MIWMYWSLLGLVVIVLLILALLSRRHRSPLRPSGPTSWGLLREAGRTFLDVLWATSHPFGYHAWRRDASDPSKDYVRERERQLRGRRSHRSGPDQD
jgi:hypothetical protein